MRRFKGMLLLAVALLAELAMRLRRTDRQLQGLALFDVTDRISDTLRQLAVDQGRETDQGIVIGKNGSKLKQIGTRSRQQIESRLGCKIFLKLFVRVQKNWRKDTKAIRKFGY